MGYWDYDDDSYWALRDEQDNYQADSGNRDDYDEICYDKMMDYSSPGNGLFWWDN